MTLKLRSCVAVAFFAVAISGCAPKIPPEALQMSPTTLEDRQVQTRRFDTTDEKDLLSASAALLQDLGFNLDESEVALGVLVGSKDRDATETGQVVGAVIFAILFGVTIPIDDDQKIRASIITKPLYTDAGDHFATTVRVTFQRIIWKTDGKIGTVERLHEPEMYIQFFDKLGKAVFLEGHEI